MVGSVLNAQWMLLLQRGLSTKAAVVVNELRGENYPFVTRRLPWLKGKLLLHHENINLTLATASLRLALQYGSASGRLDKV